MLKTLEWKGKRNYIKGKEFGTALSVNILNIRINPFLCLYLTSDLISISSFSSGLAGAETAQFAGGYGLAPFPDYGANMLQYGGNRGLRNQINLGTANMQGFIGRGGGGMQGNFQTSPFLNQGSLAHLSP